MCALSSNTRGVTFSDLAFARATDLNPRPGSHSMTKPLTLTYLRLAELCGGLLTLLRRYSSLRRREAVILKVPENVRGANSPNKGTASWLPWRHQPTKFDDIRTGGKMESMNYENRCSGITPTTLSDGRRPNSVRVLTV